MNRLFFTLMVLAGFALWSSCKEGGTVNSPDLTIGQLTLIFKDAPPNWRVYGAIGGYTPAQTMITYIDDHYITHKFFPDSTVAFDTLIILTERKQFEIRHSYKAIDNLVYLFEVGDTVLFEYVDKTPKATVLNRQETEQEVNFDLFKKQALYGEDYPAYAKLKHPILFLKPSPDFKSEIQRVLSNALEEVDNQMEKEGTFIDSLYELGSINSNKYHLLLSDLRFRKKHLELNELLGTYQNAGIPIPSQDLFTDRDSKNEPGLLHGNNIFNAGNDSLMYYGHYQDLLGWVNYYGGTKVGSIKSTNYENGVATGGGSHPDYLALYDTLSSFNLLSPKALDILKMKNVENVILHNSISEARGVIEKFRAEVTDSLIFNYLIDKYNLQKEDSGENYELKLVSMDGESLTFDSLISLHKGKVIYVDYWASWCAPCLREFEHLPSLVKRYSDKEFIHILISIDHDRDEWAKTSEKYKIESKNYWIQNLFNSRQWEDFDVEYIPRYMLYNQDGKLVNNFAPRPGDKKIHQSIGALLEK